jgi:hypothetical protein
LETNENSEDKRDQTQFLFGNDIGIEQADILPYGRELAIAVGASGGIGLAISEHVSRSAWTCEDGTR